ncbi:sulfatase [Rhodopirellula sp. SWK7]|uniref:sulfatase n=1 Tax=Rhodopirellula sp. SWK7 TaxID=595460 RepID=UPI0002BDAE3B|nr:sulfatase [Rhodopirellula sp. SWK7]EMI41327.1 iduronate-2-sulfatase [Rhodopirellula sp. SWK7]
MANLILTNEADLPGINNAQRDETFESNRDKMRSKISAQYLPINREQPRVKTNKTILIAMSLCWLFVSTANAQDDRPNILMLCIDDMNDWCGFLGGHPQAQTPHMDKLAAKGVNFTNAHCSAPGCSPSRNALLLGVEPHKSGLYPFYKLKSVDRTVTDRYTNLPRFFKENGYTTCGVTKVFHNPDNTYQENETWDDYASYGDVKIKGAMGKGFMADEEDRKKRYLRVCPGVNPPNDFVDYRTASHAVRFLEKSHGQPFFLAVGFIRPHIEFITPEANYDRFPASISSPPILENDLDDVPPVGQSMARQSVVESFEEHECWDEIRRGYLSCISFTDDNVGRVMDALEKSPYLKNTIVVLWSDHGFHLGEKRSYTKFSLWEESTRVPFIIWDPRGQSGNGSACSEPVGLINVYRTLCELTGLEPPEYVDGMSLVPWLEDPTKPMEKPAMTTWGRGNYTLRTKNWRYTRYFDGTEELYDHRKDPQEWTNLASNPEYAEMKRDLARKWLPKTEAPRVLSGKELDNVWDADKPLWKSKAN